MKKILKIGFCTDLTGPYQAVDGSGGVQAIRMAIDDCQEKLAGTTVQLLLGDHKNDPAIARNIMEGWLRDDAVDMVVSGVNSDTSLAITEVAVAGRCPVFVVGAGTTVQTTERASEFVVQYAYNTAALATVPAVALAQQGLKRWFYVTADYPFGRELESYGRQTVLQTGGNVVGHVTNPHGEENFVPFVRDALQSGATVLGLANGHAALLHAMRALRQSGAADKLAVVGLLTFLNDVQDMGLEEAQGLLLCDSWYWTRDVTSRAWSSRFLDLVGVMPSSLQAADYSAVYQYLSAVAEVDSTDWALLLKHFRGVVLNDMYVSEGSLRADGVLLHNMHLLRVKTPAASESEWDFYEEVASINGAVAFP